MVGSLSFVCFEHKYADYYGKPCHKCLALKGNSDADRIKYLERRLAAMTENAENLFMRLSIYRGFWGWDQSDEAALATHLKFREG